MTAPQQINYMAFDWIIFPIRIIVNLNINFIYK